MKRLSALLLALLFLLPGFSLSEEAAGEWHFDEKGFLTGENPGEEYLEQGAVHVFAFGPWLLSGGEVHPNLEKINNYSEPRVALGMIEPYHYILIVTAGRPTKKYQGYKLTWLADKMLEYGCTEALNLDGGDTVALAFNNKIIIHGNMEAKNLRNLGSMIAFGLK